MDCNEKIADELTVARLNIEERLIARASADPCFRSSLLSSPKAAIAEETGLILPEDVVVEVHEELPSRLHLVLPVSSGKLRYLAHIATDDDYSR